ncbi:hypothetical protein Bbelb_137770 [Branchiostoma belcheri]|nr:hypothetical protein Bbelb_137770 [Branchiostoma belcheri]
MTAERNLAPTALAGPPSSGKNPPLQNPGYGHAQAQLDLELDLLKSDKTLLEELEEVMESDTDTEIKALLKKRKKLQLFPQDLLRLEQMKYFLTQNLLLMLMLALVLYRVSNSRVILSYHGSNILIVDLLTYSKQINGFVLQQ